MSEVETSERRLPLHEQHVAAGARFAPFAGWSMPVWYTSIKDEHLCVRTRAGLFDVSHMGEVFVRGPDAIEAVNRLVTNDVAVLADGQALYTVMCREDGGIVDDLIVYRLDAETVLICVNAGNRTKDFDWIRRNLRGRAVATDDSDSWVQLALQGPLARRILADVAGEPLLSIAMFHAAWHVVAGARCLVARTGYTGEDGFELYIPVAHAKAVFDAVVAGGSAHGLQLVGLGARDSLRLEARLPLYGHEIDDTTNPIEAGLGWVVKLDKAEFVGRDALLAIKEQPLVRRLRGLWLQGRGMLRGGYEVFVGEERVGELTSGSIAYTQSEQAVGVAYIQSEFATEGTLVDVLIRDRRVAARVTSKPFYRRDRTGE